MFRLPPSDAPGIPSGNRPGCRGQPGFFCCGCHPGAKESPAPPHVTVPEICLHAPPVDQRRSNDNGRHPRGGGNLAQPFFSLQLAHSVRVDWSRRVALVELSFFAVDLYRAEKDEALDAGAGCLPREIERTIGIDCPVRADTFGPAGTEVM